MRNFRSFFRKLFFRELFWRLPPAKDRTSWRQSILYGISYFFYIYINPCNSELVFLCQIIKHSLKALFKIEENIDHLQIVILKEFSVVIKVSSFLYLQLVHAFLTVLSSEKTVTLDLKLAYQIYFFACSFVFVGIYAL